MLKEPSMSLLFEELRYTCIGSINACSVLSSALIFVGILFKSLIASRK